MGKLNILGFFLHTCHQDLWMKFISPCRFAKFNSASPVFSFHPPAAGEVNLFFH